MSGGIIDYFLSGWNYIDIVPPAGIITLVILKYIEETNR